MLTNVFNLSNEYLNVLRMAELGADPEIIADTLESIQAALDVKVDNTIGLIRSVEGDIDAIDKEIKRLQDVKKVKQNLTKRLKKYLQDMLDYRQLKNYRTPTNYIYKRKNAASVHIIDESLIDKSYFIEQAPKLDKKALKEDLKKGADIHGAELRDSESLVIK